MNKRDRFSEGFRPPLFPSPFFFPLSPSPPPHLCDGQRKKMTLTRGGMDPRRGRIPPPPPPFPSPFLLVLPSATADHVHGYGRLSWILGDPLLLFFFLPEQAKKITAELGFGSPPLSFLFPSPFPPPDCHQPDSMRCPQVRFSLPLFSW